MNAFAKLATAAAAVAAVALIAIIAMPRGSGGVAGPIGLALAHAVVTPASVTRFLAVGGRRRVPPGRRARDRPGLDDQRGRQALGQCADVRLVQLSGLLHRHGHRAET